ncbi:hypothetical protein PHMEG_0008337 [Phytophthora megakarya]|uniref:Uncharacterized protein n=1 Tax=Phytophthora megakarya TaxID=4795 RepID=A0A225WJF3_9STRA|nr:hypothetical protein PHMEG_0008337 [Phytophthora megakarya]
MVNFILSALPPTGTSKPRQIDLFCFKPCLDEEGKQTGYYSYKSCGKTPKHAQAGYTKFNPISVETLTATMEAVIKAVEEAIGETMSDRYGIILKG